MHCKYLLSKGWLTSEGEKNSKYTLLLATESKSQLQGPEKREQGRNVQLRKRPRKAKIQLCEIMWLLQKHTTCLCSKDEVCGGQLRTRTALRSQGDAARTHCPPAAEHTTNRSKSRRKKILFLPPWSPF